MTYTVLLDSNANTRECEDEERSKFIRSILESLSVDLEFWPSDKTVFTTEERISLRGLLKELDLTIVENVDGSLEVYFERKQIGEWRKPNYVLKSDPKEPDPKKRLYLEMHVTFTSVFEESATAN